MKSPVLSMIAIYSWCLCVGTLIYCLFSYFEKKRMLSFVSGLAAAGFGLFGGGSLIAYITDKPHQPIVHDFVWYIANLIGISGWILLAAAFFIAIWKKV